MKKIFKILVLLVICSFTSQVNALNISSDKTVYKVGEEFIITIRSNDDALKKASFSLSLNNEYFELKKIAGANGLVGTTQDNTYSFSSENENFVLQPGYIIARATIKVTNNIKESTNAKIKIENFNITLTDDTVKALTSETLNFTIEKPEELSSDATLMSLTSNVTKIDFNKNTTNYTVDVENEILSLNLIATPNNKKATVVINGDKDFIIGENKIEVIVSAEDGTKKTYNILVNKKGSSVNKLKSITIYEPSFYFQENKYDYEITITNPDVTSLKIDFSTIDEKSTVEITGNKDFKLGENIVKLKVTAENGSTRDYTIIVNKETEQKENKVKKENKLLIHGLWASIASTFIVLYILELNKNRKIF